MTLEAHILKPCPFCGAPAVRMELLDNGMKPCLPDQRVVRFVGCRKCCVASFADVTEEECVEKWNRRAE